MERKENSKTSDKEKGWTILWLIIFIIPSFWIWDYSQNAYWITICSIIALLLYEFAFIRFYLEKKGIGLRPQILDRIKKYTAKSEDYNQILQKISISVSAISALTAVTFSLIIFSLVFFYLAKVKVGLNPDTFLIFGMLSSLITAGICYLISLDQYDTASDPSFDVNIKWQMRKLGLSYFVYGWYFLIFGVFIGLSLIHPLLTLIGCCCYIIIHNKFWFQTLKCVNEPKSD